MRKVKLVQVFALIFVILICSCFIACSGTPREITVSNRPDQPPTISTVKPAPALPPPPVVAQENQVPAATADDATKPAAEAEKAFVGSKNSTKYHLPSCEWAKKIAASNQVWFSTSQEAQAKGYAACKVCKPP